jgi:hypothetical protein
VDCGSKLAVSHRDTEAAEAEERGKGWMQRSPNPFFSSDLCALCASVGARARAKRAGRAGWPAVPKPPKRDRVPAPHWIALYKILVREAGRLSRLSYPRRKINDC